MKKKIPYLLSTTATLSHIKQYYFSWFDTSFNCNRNRDYYSVYNAKVNVNRIWHDVVIPNAIIIYENCPRLMPTISDALEALKYALKANKTERALKANAELFSDKETMEPLLESLKRSWVYYACGGKIAKDPSTGKEYIYALPKAKQTNLTAYIGKIFKFGNFHMWKSPWGSLNRLVQIAYDDRSMCKLSQKELAKRYNVSETTAAKFVRWRDQLCRYYKKTSPEWDLNDPQYSFYWAALKEEIAEPEVPQSEEDDPETLPESYYKWVPSTGDRPSAPVPKADFSLDFLAI